MVNDLSRTFHILKVLYGKTWVMLIQYFLPSLAMCSFFSLSDNCFMDFLIVFSNIFFLYSLEFIHSTRKSISRTGSTLKSLFRSTLGCYSSTIGWTGSIFYTFFYYWALLLFFFIAFSYSSRAYCYFLSFSSKMACFSF